jgi:hypothetical protein
MHSCDATNAGLLEAMLPIWTGLEELLLVNPMANFLGEAPVATLCRLIDLGRTWSLGVPDEASASMDWPSVSSFVVRDLVSEPAAETSPVQVIAKLAIKITAENANSPFLIEPPLNNQLRR